MKKPAQAGDPEAQYRLGMMHVQGVGIERNLESARKWLSAAKKNRYTLAQSGLNLLQGLVASGTTPQ